ncbi:hypothetical protein HETIRDRAFT_417808 [Heterobasidion irregulare TC 32-1]|uniref:Uncharacterized protein n=1 Tax=Heterobasidion irregulare (strain TC 32-1) TaxID=747525 RepID=W4K9I4_HETIT|nr:uncharacterized protein HETIRDRAFT_417808 [Heterobasidion irregulare TC 32-1]ETW81736.1 hypothetical protein HETIRDRAFT_417808 [Heterobasidion irregulare TC 32-1]
MNVLRYHRLRLNLTPKRWLSTVNGGKLSERLLERLKSSEPEVISSSGEALGRRQVASSNLLDTLNLVVTDQKHSHKGRENQKQRYKKRKEKQKQRKSPRNNEPTSAPSEVVTPDQIAGILSNIPLVQDVAEASDDVIESHIDYNDRDGAPHIPRTLLYTRRVEGVLHSLKDPILKGM